MKKSVLYENKKWDINFTDKSKCRSDIISTETFTDIVKAYKVVPSIPGKLTHYDTIQTNILFHKAPCVFPDKIVDVIVSMFNENPTFPQFIIVDNGEKRYSISCSINKEIKYATMTLNDPEATMEVLR